MGTEACGMTEGDARSRCWSNAHLVEQPQSRVSGSKWDVCDENERLRVVDKLLSAAIRALKLSEQRVQLIEIRIGLRFIPDPQREQHQDVQKVVVEQDGE